MTQEPPTTPGQRATILVVDDDAANRRLMESALSGEYALAFSVDGLGAVASACAETCDLVLMDVDMPGIDGIEATRRIRTRLGSDAPPIIMLTAFSDHNSVNAAFEAGAADYVSKPFNLKELLGRIRSTLERKHMRDDLVRARNGLEAQVRERTASLLEARDALEGKVEALRQTEDRLQASLAHLDGILDSVSDAILTTEEDGRIVSINRAAVRLFGYSPDELTARNFADLLPVAWRTSLETELRHQVDIGIARAAGLGPREMEGLRKDGSTFPIELALSEMRVGGRRLFVGVVRDITERKRNAERIAQLANFDTVTGLANRNLFLDRLNHAMQQALRGDRLLGLFFMDLDGFKRVNDTLGHHVGDELLRSVGERLSAIVRKTDTVARVGGDEFTIVLEGLESVEAIGEVARKILDAMRQPFHLQGYEVVVSISIGVAIFPFDTEDIAELLKNADKAMYQAKEAGRNQVQFYEHSLFAVQVDRLKMEEELR
ncbi:MAG: diguanylate cyclase, partial [Betaproteobacteria bacterium]|nr:diguanylate cyclase [Betaproteobacteria bacterium]